MPRHFSWTVTVRIRQPLSVRDSVNAYRPPETKFGVVDLGSAPLIPCGALSSRIGFR